MDVNVSFPMNHLKDARRRQAKLFVVAYRTLGLSTRHDTQQVVWGEADPSTERLVRAFQTWLTSREPDALAALEDMVRELRARERAA